MTTDYTPSHDAAGNLTDDGKDYAYVYDAWYRLRQIKNRTSGNVVSEHTYYGNGFRAGEHYDSDASGTVDSSDKWFWFAYDERWRILGTYRDADSNPKERFLHHTAGLGGYGSSSYIDDVVLRERDANTDWNGTASDGTLEERLYYCQNWRHDVVALVTSGGAIKERAKYFSYGIPFGIPLGDCDGDGDVDAADQSILLGASGTSTVRCDLNLDGTVNASDQSIQSGEYGATSGWERLSRSRNRLGYAGYCADMAVNTTLHVRHRILVSVLGRWVQRDRTGYVDGPSLYGFARCEPILWNDTYGSFATFFFSRVQDNWVGACGWFDCDARKNVWNGPMPLFRVDIVARVEREIGAVCCPGDSGDHRWNVGFYERWDTITLRPLERWTSTDLHSLSDTSRRCACSAYDVAIVPDVRLLTHVSQEWWTAHNSIDWPLAPPCLSWGADWSWGANAASSAAAPPGWEEAAGANTNIHRAAVFWGPCSGLPTSGSCIPGVNFTDHPGANGPGNDCGCTTR
ncbi:MAG: RHS repeat-associated core domain-containing protein [Phycisphaerales bacterium]